MNSRASFTSCRHPSERNGQRRRRWKLAKARDRKNKAASCIAHTQETAPCRPKRPGRLVLMTISGAGRMWAAVTGGHHPPALSPKPRLPLRGRHRPIPQRLQCRVGQCTEAGRRAKQKGKRPPFHRCFLRSVLQAPVVATHWPGGSDAGFRGSGREPLRRRERPSFAGKSIALSSPSRFQTGRGWRPVCSEEATPQAQYRKDFRRVGALLTGTDPAAAIRCRRCRRGRRLGIALSSPNSGALICAPSGRSAWRLPSG